MTQMNLSMKQKQIYRHSRFVLAKGSKGGGRKDWEFGVSRYKLVYTEWINNKVLLDSTGNCIRYLVRNHNGKAYEKEYI